MRRAGWSRRRDRRSAGGRRRCRSRSPQRGRARPSTDARQRGRRRLRRRHHLGHRHRTHPLPRVRTATRTRTAEDNPNQPYAGLSSVHGWTAESTADSPPPSCINPNPRPITASPTSLTGSAPGTGHGQRSRNRRSAPVNSSIGGPAFHPGHIVPQRQSLRVAQQFPDAAGDDHPLTQRSAVGLHLRPIRRRADHRPLRQQVPRALAGLRMGGILVVDGQLVADLAAGDQLATRRGLDQRDHPATARRIHPEPVVRRCRSRCRSGSQPSAASAGASR